MHTMSAAKTSDTPSFHQPFLSEPQSLHPQPPQYVVVAPPYLPRYLNRRLHQSWWCRFICVASILLFIAAAVYLLWPSDPELSVVRLKLNRLHFHSLPKISLDVTLDLMVKVQNKDFYSMDYDSLVVTIGYRGERLGFMTSAGGHMKARGSSYVNATLRLDGVEVLSEVILFLEDLARGSITFDTESEVNGKLGFFFFELPIKTKISCEVIVNTRNQTITHQNCYPEI